MTTKRLRTFVDSKEINNNNNNLNNFNLDESLAPSTEIINNNNKWWCDSKITSPYCRVYDEYDYKMRGYRDLRYPLHLYSTHQECNKQCTLSSLPLVTHSLISQYVSPGDVELAPNFYSKFSTIIDTNQKNAKKLYKLWQMDQKSAKEEFLKKKNIGATRFALDALLHSTNNNAKLPLLEFIFQNKSIFDLVNKRRWAEIFTWYPFLTNMDYIKKIIDSKVLDDYKLLFIFIKQLNFAKEYYLSDAADDLDTYQKIIDHIGDKIKEFIKKELFSDRINDHEKANIIFESLLEGFKYGAHLLSEFDRNDNIAVMTLENLLDYINSNPNELSRKWLEFAISLILKYGSLFKKMDKRSLFILNSLYGKIAENDDDEKQHFIETIINSDILGDDGELMVKFIQNIDGHLQQKMDWLLILLSKYHELFTNKSFQNYILNNFGTLELYILDSIPWNHPEESKKFNKLVIDDLANKIENGESIVYQNMIVYLKIVNNMLLTHTHQKDNEMKYEFFKRIDTKSNSIYLYGDLYKWIVDTEFSGPDKFEKAYKMLKEHMIFFPMDTLLAYDTFNYDYIGKWKNICKDEKKYTSENENKNIIIYCKRNFPSIYDEIVKQIDWKNMPKFSDDEIPKYNLKDNFDVEIKYHENENGGENEMSENET